MVVCAIISSSYRYRTISKYIQYHYDQFDRHLNLNWNSCPAYTTIRNIILGIDIKELEEVFRIHAKELINFVGEHRLYDKKHVAIDGKALRGTKNLESLVIFATEEQIILSNTPIEEKTNEIPKAQEELREMDIEESVLFSFDALHMQKKTVEIIESINSNNPEKEIGVLIQVKGNQESLYKAVQLRSKVSRDKDEYLEEDTSHGRTVRRKVIVYHGGLLDYCIQEIHNWNASIRDIIKVEVEREEGDGISKETRWYVSTLSYKKAKYYSVEIRNHWKIENNNNWVLDTVLEEDKHRMKKGAMQMHILKSMGLNILRANGIKRNLKNKMYEHMQSDIYTYNYCGLTC
jgi:predicted transposase YbfD/YdcC